MQTQDNQVRFFDSYGNDLGTFGRPGDGPGEFRRPVRGGWIADTLWVSDVMLNRVTLISLDGRLVRTEPPLTIATPRPSDRDRLPVFSFIYPYAAYGDGAVLAVAQGRMGDPLAEIVGPSLIRISHGGEVERLIATLPESLSTVRVMLDDRVATVPVPFSQRPLWAVSSDGARVAILTTKGQGSESVTVELTVYDATNGSVAFSRTFPFPGEPIPGRLIDSAIAGQARASQPPLRGAIESEVRAQVPRVYAPVIDLFIGEDQRVWLALRRTRTANPWIVLGPSGEPIGRVSVPPSVALKVAASDHVWGLEADDFDVESVVRFRLPDLWDIG